MKSESEYVIYPNDKSALLCGKELAVVRISVACAKIEHQNETERIYGDMTMFIPAYDTSELGVMLPRDIMTGKFLTEYFCWKAVGHSCYSVQKEITDYYEPEARGKMYLWLLKEGYIKEDK